MKAVLVVAVLGACLAGCAQADATAGEEANLNGEVAKVEAITGTELNKVSLAPEATQRLGIATAPVVLASVNGRPHVAVPYGAVIYDAHGDAFVYTIPEPNVFVRARVEVLGVEGELAAVNGAPAVGTPVVTVGVSELLGTETGVGDE